MDLPFLMLVCMLTGVGLIMMFSASFASALYNSSDAVRNNPWYYIQRQAVFAAIGLVGMYIVSRMNYEYFRILAIPALVFSIVLLVLVLLPGFHTVRSDGVKRWFKGIGPIPSLQPSEIAKVAVILFFSARLSKRDTERQRRFTRRTSTGRFLNWLEKIGFLELVPYGVVMAVVLGLVVAEPHMSGTVLILVGAAAVLFISGVSLKWFVGLGSIALTALTFIVFATDYMTRKINLWLDPWSEPRDGGYQIIQSLYAIASGGLLGLGLGNSRQKFLYIPEPQNDFLFPIVVEELGLVGGLLVLMLFALLILRGYWLALHARDKFGTLTIAGIITLLAAQVFLNIGVVTGLIPNTGIALPFFSYGGSALAIQLGEMGMVLSISRQIPAPRKD
ncbi:MAG: FtsW/RodA/SpoVE family cell cycle protein [Lawsonibacter sp.]|nr:FtsW/RodA/SpoVE family cell cycle protein [Lawsonibacter sp.]